MVTVQHQVAPASPHATRSRSFVAALVKVVQAPPAEATLQVSMDPAEISQGMANVNEAEALQGRREKGARIQSAPSTSYNKRKLAADEFMGGRSAVSRAEELVSVVEPVEGDDGGDEGWGPSADWQGPAHGTVVRREQTGLKSAIVTAGSRLPATDCFQGRLFTGSQFRSPTWQSEASETSGVLSSTRFSCSSAEGLILANRDRSANSIFRTSASSSSSSAWSSDQGTARQARSEPRVLDTGKDKRLGPTEDAICPSVRALVRGADQIYGKQLVDIGHMVACVGKDQSFGIKVCAEFIARGWRSTIGVLKSEVADLLSSEEDNEYFLEVFPIRARAS